MLVETIGDSFGGNRWLVAIENRMIETIGDSFFPSGVRARLVLSERRTFAPIGGNNTNTIVLSTRLVVALF